MKGIELSVISEAFNLAPVAAIELFDRKGYAVSWDWREQLTMNHRKVFTVAKAMRMDILQDIRNEVHKAMESGATFAQFKQDLSPRLRAKGWWGKVEGVQLGSPHRLKTIFQTNVQSSLNAGRWKSFEANKEARPYLKYVAVLDASTRPSHAELHGTIKDVESPYWDTMAPPNGYSCRCRLRALSVNQMLRSEQKIPPEVEPDKGFHSNPGQTEWDVDMSKYDTDIAHMGNSVPYVPVTVPKQPILESEKELEGELV